MVRCRGFGLCLVIALCTVLQNSGSEGSKCLTDFKEITPKRVVQMDGRSLDIRFELSRRITQRLTTRIMRIFLVEVLGYPGVSLVEKDDQFDTIRVFDRLSDNSGIDVRKNKVPETMVNMEVWIPGQMDTSLMQDDYKVKECGSIAPSGYFGWFVPRSLWPDKNLPETWRIFTDRNSVQKFDVEDVKILSSIKRASLIPDSPNHLEDQTYCTLKSCHEGIYVPKQCLGPNTPCAMLLAAYPDVTDFVTNEIQKYNLFVKVAWVGPHLKNLTQTITDHYKSTNSSKSLVILHWTPSVVVPKDEDFVSIVFPRCTETETVECRYDANRLVKVVWEKLENVAKVAYESIRRATFTGQMYVDLLEEYNDRQSELEDFGKVDEDALACNWLRRNLNDTIAKWTTNIDDKMTLSIGGIFPVTGSSYKDRSIILAATMASTAINANDSVLRDYKLDLLASDGQCKSDMVMKSFIDYVVHRYSSLIGILGPACSETIEPLIGVSTQYKTMMISYSAEGSNFDDRTKYPYFFRTIAENIQYKHVYLSLLKEMKWKRVAALTEDGQKYTEYISHLQIYLQKNDITFVDNAKYPKKTGSDVIYDYLENLKKKRAKIIIADVYDDAARQVMCDAYKLNMTAFEGYVWFLPLWLLPNWWDTDYHRREGSMKDNVTCTTSQMRIAVNGYLGMSHAYYAPDDSLMQEDITVRQWRNHYESQCRAKNQTPSDYAGYAYDATWTYAYAMDQLIRENQSYAYTLHNQGTIDRFTEVISRTDFQGVSGRINFIGGGASRISSVEIVQYVNNETNKIGIFHPDVPSSGSEVLGGVLDLNTSAIVWLTSDGEVPNDGTEPDQKCVFGSLAEVLDVTCEVAIIVVNIIGFGCLGILLIIGFIIVKRKYDEKVRLHEMYMQSLGIDLLQTDTSGLDKWEIPRECVVINRKLGEGAFGTVYGGEAFFTEKGWLAVAVKTLKVGSSTEEKLDFLSEVEVMKRFEHKNIIKLLGVCIKCEPVYTVMEFMLYGDLKTYLLARRHLVNDRNYEDYDEISSKKLTAMALDVARALSYLAELKYVHRDIASRNCLVNAQRVVKLGDFGMTRPMYENDYYKFNRKGMLPVRWMAPESLGLGIFTPASDVWSYGVLLYEIITFGSFPYQGLSNNEVLEHVKSGNTITIPSGIKAPLENLIRSCWTVDYKSRPNAPEIVDFLATNPRLLSPCLDVPLASVQLEHKGQIDIQLPERFRKFSVSLPKSNNLSPRRNSAQTISEAPLMVIGEDPDLQSFITAVRYDSESSTADSFRPLLDESTNDPKSRYVQLERTCNNNLRNDDDDRFQVRYVNIQPGGGFRHDVDGNVPLISAQAIINNDKESTAAAAAAAAGRGSSCNRTSLL